jgi:hypothetical protein
MWRHRQNEQVLMTGNAIGRPIGCGLTRWSGPGETSSGRSQCGTGLFLVTRQQLDRREVQET